MLTDEDFDTLIIMIKSLRRTLLKSPRSYASAQGVVTFIIVSLNFAATVVLILLGVDSEKFPDQIWDFFRTLGTHCGLIDRKFGASMAIYKSDSPFFISLVPLISDAIIVFLVISENSSMVA